jgi:hypothetical protein
MIMATDTAILCLFPHAQNLVLRVFCDVVDEEATGAAREFEENTGAILSRRAVCSIKITGAEGLDLSIYTA